MNSADILDALEKNLKRYDEVELILLKGHLILEQALNEHLSFYIKDKDKLKNLNLMFSKKLDLLVALEGKDPFQIIEGIKHLKELNRIRNKLAHQLDFQGYHSDLKKWACAVVGYTPKTINRKTTYRNTLLKAFYMMTGFLIGFSVARNTVLESNDPTGRAP